MAENWIEKAVDEIYNLSMSTSTELNNVQLKRVFALSILKYAPVIDAEKLAEKITDDYEDSCDGCASDDLPYPDEKRIAAVITSNLELSITWVENKAEWGDFTLEIEEPIHGNKFWQWSVRLAVGGRMGTAKSKEDCQAACVDALTKIISGGKDVG